MKAINPTTELLIRDYPEHSPAAIAERLDQAQTAFQAWRRKLPEDRAALMKRLAKGLREHRTTHAQIMTEEMGKPIAAAEAEVDKCAWNCDYYAENAAAFLASREIPTEARTSFIRYDPLGPILAIMPWNFPFWQLFRCAVPALMAGNVVLLKHAANVPGSAQAIEILFQQAGFPPVS